MQKEERKVLDAEKKEERSRDCKAKSRGYDCNDWDAAAMSAEKGGTEKQKLWLDRPCVDTIKES